MRIYISFDTEEVLATNGLLRRDIVVFGRQFLIDAMNEDPEKYKAFDNFEFLNKLSAAMASGWVAFLETIQHKLWMLDEQALDHGDSLKWCEDEFADTFRKSKQTFLANVEALECPVYDATVLGLLVDRVDAGYQDMQTTLVNELERVFERAWIMFRL
ncbi:hypothetical protein pEaSNUABM11_00244 [Erwinia phage pEa_SNUABM_11]|nr:hypothetical protein pEaSNUABM11_00244 [Erwinia phage pEa_SNUABM_11]